MGTKVSIGLTRPVRVLWPALHAPKVFRGADGRESEPYYEATLLIPNDHPDLKALREAMAKEAKLAKSANPRLPLRDGDAEEKRNSENRRAAGKEPYDNSFLRGHQVLRTRAVATRPPNVFDARSAGVKAVLLAGEAAIKERVYSGAFVSAIVNINAYTGMGGGVTAYLNDIAVAQDAQRLGGIDVAELFGNITGRQSPGNEGFGDETF